MGKAINALVNRAEEENEGYNPNVVRLSCVDVLHHKGSRDRAIVKKPKRDPQSMVVLAVRKVVYLYDKKTTIGHETVVEQSMSLKDAEAHAYLVPEIVEEITRDLRTPGYTERKEREYVQDEV